MIVRAQCGAGEAGEAGEEGEEGGADGAGEAGEGWERIARRVSSAHVAHEAGAAAFAAGRPAAARALWLRALAAAGPADQVSLTTSYSFLIALAASACCYRLETMARLAYCSKHYCPLLIMTIGVQI